MERHSLPRSRNLLLYGAIAIIALCLGRGAPAANHSGIQDIDGAAIGLFDQAPDTWLSNGRSYSEQRYAPLDSINADNVGNLGLAWQGNLESQRWGIEATPLVADGLIYISGNWSRVFAFDARTGRRVWSFDPQVAPEWLRNTCCGPVNRGVALWKGKIYVGVLDGRLIALDAKTGAKLWDVSTTDGKPYYSITGAPRVANGRVIIGNGGGDFATRGFFSAFDADTGKLLWRFYVTPGDPKNGFENADIAMAAKTWDSNRDWSFGGDGNSWDAIAYDPDLDLIYVGTGNGGWVDQPKKNHDSGDKLFICSIVAVKADTGRLAWYYQTTPNDHYDFDATQPIVLADLKIGGVLRKVLMQAPKNGFFYVLDRANGQLISAEKYVHVNWASRVDLKSGRPVLTSNADYSKGPTLVLPSAHGAHNWEGMAFNPRTGLVYIPARDIGTIWGVDTPTWFQNGYDLSKLTHEDVETRTGGLLIAWDPVAQKPAWQVKQPTLINGGTLTTAGNLVVQGTEDGFIRFYAADTGKLLHQIPVGTGITAPPVSYMIDGVQYIAVAAGWQGWKLRRDPQDAPPPFDNAGRLIVLKLGGGAVPTAERTTLPPFLVDDTPQPAAEVATGLGLYQEHCARCHGTYGERALPPDLRRMSKDTFDAFRDIVIGGALKSGGMATFADVIKPTEADAIRAYLLDWAQRSRRGDFDPIAKTLTPAARPQSQKPRVGL